MQEQSIERRLKNAVERLGGQVRKLTAWRGDPDRLIIMPYGAVWFVEVKAPGRVPTPLQQHRMRQLQRLGHRATWVASAEDVDALVAEMQDVIEGVRQGGV